MFNAGDFVGRYMPLLKPFSLVPRKGLFLLCVARVLFIPCFYFAAKFADAGWMILLGITLGWTNGYLTVLGMMLAPRGYSVSLILTSNSLANVYLVFWKHYDAYFKF